MSRLTSLKEYNRVTAQVRAEFRRVKDQADRDFYTGLDVDFPTFDEVEKLLRARDAVISDAYRGRREEAALAWQLYRSENPRPGA